MERLEQQHAQHMDKYSGSGNEMKGLGFSAAGAATITTGCSTGWTCMMLVAVLFNRLIRIERTRFRQQGSSTRKKTAFSVTCLRTQWIADLNLDPLSRFDSYRDIPRENRTVSFILTVDLSMRAECMHEK